MKLHKITLSIFKVFYFSAVSAFGYKFALEAIPSHTPMLLGGGNSSKM